MTSAPRVFSLPVSEVNLMTDQLQFVFRLEQRKKLGKTLNSLQRGIKRLRILRLERKREERAARKIILEHKREARVAWRAERAAKGIRRSSKYVAVPPVKNVIVFARGRIALRCSNCNGVGMIFGELATEAQRCRVCRGDAFFGIDGRLPTTAPPSSEEKVCVMVARYEAGLPLFNPDDSTGVTDDEEKALHFAEDHPPDPLIPEDTGEDDETYPEAAPEVNDEIEIQCRRIDDQASDGPRTNHSLEQGQNKAVLCPG